MSGRYNCPDIQIKKKTLLKEDSHIVQPTYKKEKNDVSKQNDIIEWTPDPHDSRSRSLSKYMII